MLQLAHSVLDSARRRRRWYVFLAGCGVVIASYSSSFRRLQLDRSIESLLQRVERQGLHIDRASLRWLAPPTFRFFSIETVAFLARRSGEFSDVYVLHVGSVGLTHARYVIGLWNMTRSPSSFESDLVWHEPYLAYTSRVGDEIRAVSILDLRGEPAETTRGWSWHATLRNALSNHQETGQFRGVTRRRYDITPPPQHAALQQGDDVLSLVLDGQSFAFRPTQPRMTLGAYELESDPYRKSPPSWVTWAVDYVRKLPGVGTAPIEWLEHHVFAAKDVVQRMYHRFFAERKTGKQITSELALGTPSTGDASSRSDQVDLSAYGDAELHWPPPSLRPLMTDRLQGEGEWFPIIDEHFVASNPDAPPAFYQTFLRTDAERTFAPTYITLWDPRQVQLDVVMGTREPESATGETGKGVVPRDPEVVSRLVGAFNGGFQAMHGEFGMMADGRVYLPPKPWAATVAVMQDGRVAMGSWPGPTRSSASYDEATANEQIPESMVAMRQNLTSVVEDGVYNPWKRWWWGAAPLNAKEQTFTHRTGLCLTQEGFMAFFWGTTLDAETLGKAMIAARCARGMHLDMNSGHCGFEFYKVYPPGHAMSALGRRVDDSEYEGALPYLDGYRVRVRKAVRSMVNMRFPRYTSVEARDFFYLTLKPVLPGAPLVGAYGSSGKFSSQGLPHHGWPPAFAKAAVETQPANAAIRTDGTDAAAPRVASGSTLDAHDARPPRTWVVRIDPQRLRVVVASDTTRNALATSSSSPSADPMLAAVLSVRPYGSHSATGESNDPTRSHVAGIDWVRVRYRQQAVWVTEPRQVARAIWTGPVLDARANQASSTARVALGVDENGHLVYFERTGVDAPPIEQVMRSAGVARALDLSPRDTAQPSAGLRFSPPRTKTSSGSAPSPAEHKWVDLDARPASEPIGRGKTHEVFFLHETAPVAEVMFPETKPVPYRVWGYLQGRRVRYIPTHPPRFQKPEPPTR
jgi:hypothetical protein